MARLLNWDAHYVGIKATLERQQNYITLDELVDEVMPLLSRYAPITIASQIPVFTEWVASDLKGNMASLKNYYLSKQYQLLEKTNGNGHFTASANSKQSLQKYKRYCG